MVQQPLVGQGPLIIEASRSYSNTPRSVGLLWTSDRPVTEIPTIQHTTNNRQTSIFLEGFGRAMPNTREAAVPRLRPHGH
jgi:hypothetical protein